MNDLQWLPDGYEPENRPEASIYTFLFKVASRCNLDCDYCYVYQGPDQSWRTQPKFMSDEVATRALERIADHVTEKRLSEVAITFHGGEPLLAGAERLSRFIGAAKRIVPCKIDFGIQTNGTLLTEEILNLFSEHDVRIGLSIDGNRLQNDLHRKFRNGKGSHSRVLKGIHLTKTKPEWDRLLTGYLSVIDLKHDPIEVFDFLVSLDGKGFNILLPDCNYMIPPPRPEGEKRDVAYGVWMATMFDHWLETQSRVEIRYFEEIIAMIFGVDSTTEAIGAKYVDLIVIESNGEIESVDSLKMVGRDATTLGLNVATHSFSEALGQVQVQSRLVGYEGLCETCRSCSILNQCGGGYIPHRYSIEHGFMNPSVYCNDIKYLVNHLKTRLNENVGA